MRHAAIVEKEKTRSIFILAAFALAIGGLIGFALTRWDDSTFSGVSNVHSRLQTAAANPTQVDELFPLNDLPGLTSHIGISYTLLGIPSGQLVTAVEVTANFNDGYQFSCIVLLVFPTGKPVLRACAEGDQISLPAQ